MMSAGNNYYNVGVSYQNGNPDPYFWSDARYAAQSAKNDFLVAASETLEGIGWLGNKLDEGVKKSNSLPLQKMWSASQIGSFFLGLGDLKLFGFLRKVENSALVAAEGGIGYRVMAEAELTGAKIGKYADGPYMNPPDYGKKWVWGSKEQAEGWKAVLDAGRDVPHVITEIRTKNPLSTYEFFDHGSRPPGSAYLVPFEHLGPATPIR